MTATDLLAKHGSAKTGKPPAREHPDGVSDDTVEALGKLSEALETVEHARGHLYAFHRLSGTADRVLQEAVDQLRDAGHDQLADEIAEVMVGRDVIDGRWTFQLVDEYDAGYWSVFRDVEQTARQHVGLADKHVFEAEMKAREQAGDAG